MIIVFKKGEMIIDHETGVRTRYQAADLTRLRALEEKSLAENQARIDELNSNLVKIQTSIGVI